MPSGPPLWRPTLGELKPCKLPPVTLELEAPRQLPRERLTPEKPMLDPLPFAALALEALARGQQQQLCKPRSCGRSPSSGSVAS